MRQAGTVAAGMWPVLGSVGVVSSGRQTGNEGLLWGLWVVGKKRRRRGFLSASVRRPANGPPSAAASAHRRRSSQHVAPAKCTTVGAEQPADVGDRFALGAMGKASRKAPSALDGDGAPAPHAPATKEAFARYRDELLGRVPDDIKARFLEGGFCKWGKEWLPVLELGPFDVPPGPVRDMWLDMFAKSQEQGRGMKRLVYWYGVEHGDRGRAYSFVNETQLVDWKKGKREGYHNIPTNIQSKNARQQKLSKSEEQQQRGLIELKVDMELDTAERAM